MARTPSSKRTSTPSSWPTLCQAPQGPQRPGALRAHLQSLDDAAKSVQAKSASPNCSCPCPITYRSSFSSRSCRTKSRLIRAINPAMMMARTTAGRRERFANRTSISLIVEIIGAVVVVAAWPYMFSLMRFLMAGRRKPHQLTTHCAARSPAINIGSVIAFAIDRPKRTPKFRLASFAASFAVAGRGLESAGNARRWQLRCRLPCR